MPRPKSKGELEIAVAGTFQRLQDSVDTFSKVELEAKFPFEHRDKNVRDVIAHLREWQVMMLRWYEEGMKGAKPVMPAEGYTWKTTPALNAVIWERYQSRCLEDVRSALECSHLRICEIIASHSNEELFSKRLYHWTGTTSLGAYVISATSSHYEWALRLLRRFRQSIDG